MEVSSELLFFFSALGAFNGVFLGLYFALFIKNRTRATYFLAGLLFVVSVRVAKSVFLTFYPGTSSTFIHIGLTACLLIGPFLYLYTQAVYADKVRHKLLWLLHVLPAIFIMTVIAYY